MDTTTTKALLTLEVQVTDGHGQADSILLTTGVSLVTAHPGIGGYWLRYTSTREEEGRAFIPTGAHLVIREEG